MANLVQKNEVTKTPSFWDKVGNFFGNVGSFLASPITSIVNGVTTLLSNKQTNKVNQNIADENLAYQREANESNLAYQREANAQNIAFQREINDLNYYRQLEENNLTREREDNAVQRAMADVAQAGLSKTLATGLSANASGMNIAKAESPVYDKLSQQALKNEFQYQNVLKNLDVIGSATSIYKTLSEGMVNKAYAENLASSSAYNQVRADNYVEEMIPRIAYQLANTELTKQQKTMLEQEFGITEYDFGKMFNADLTSTGKSPEHIVSSNELTKEQLKARIDLINSQVIKTKTNTLLDPLLDVLKIFVLPKKIGLSVIK